MSVILMLVGLLISGSAWADVLAPGVYQRADEIRPGERGFVCLCSGPQAATTGTMKTETGEERAVLIVSGRKFWPERIDPKQAPHIPRE